MSGFLMTGMRLNRSHVSRNSGVCRSRVCRAAVGQWRRLFGSPAPDSLVSWSKGQFIHIPDLSKWIRKDHQNHRVIKPSVRPTCALRSRILMWIRVHRFKLTREYQYSAVGDLTLQKPSRRGRERDPEIMEKNSSDADHRFRNWSTPTPQFDNEPMKIRRSHRFRGSDASRNKKQDDVIEGNSCVGAGIRRTRTNSHQSFARAGTRVTTDRDPPPDESPPRTTMKGMSLMMRLYAALWMT